MDWSKAPEWADVHCFAVVCHYYILYCPFTGRPLYDGLKGIKSDNEDNKMIKTLVTKIEHVPSSNWYEVHNTKLGARKILAIVPYPDVKDPEVLEQEREVAMRQASLIAVLLEEHHNKK